MKRMQFNIQLDRDPRFARSKHIYKIRKIIHPLACYFHSVKSKKT